MHTMLKVCGLTNHPLNYPVVGLDGLTHVGFIFSASSPRFTQQTFVTPNLKRTGVFVNAEKQFMLETITRHQLDVVQLHGHESPETCREMRKHCQVIKAFGVAEGDDLKQCERYHDTCDLFLFDTKTPAFGGSGKTFDWEVLAHYNGPTRFLLSGGIGLSSIKELSQFTHPFCAGLDLNSQFELEPGIKNHQLIALFIHELHNYTSIFSRS